MIDWKCAEGRNAPLIGASASASWAWGTSLVLGMEICQQKGLLAFAIWALANTLTLVLFGFLMNRGIIKPKVFDNRIVKGVALVIQMFCLVIQLNIINQTLGNFIDNGIVTYAIASGIGILTVLAMFRHGLPTSIRADRIKWGIVMASVALIIVLGLVMPVNLMQFPASGAADVSWAAWSACILLSGLIGDVQHWQRALADETRKGYYWGALFFGAYMLGIFGMAHFEFNLAMNAALLVACLAVTVSTINSIAVAMHELGGKRIGTAVSIAICLLWGLGVGVGIIELWSSFGIVRVCFAIIIVVSSVVVAEVVSDARLKGAREEQR